MLLGNLVKGDLMYPVPMSEVTIPCTTCITKAMCRHRSYFQIAKCPLLKPLYEKTHFAVDNEMAPHKPHKELIIRALSPTQWVMDEKGWVHEKGFVAHPGNDGIEEPQ